MGLKLLENSEHYHKKADEYELFSKAEDHPKRIINFLKPLFKNKIVLDMGVGNGKFAKVLAPITKRYVGIDISKEQLKKARENCLGVNNIRFIRCSAEKIPFPSGKADIVFGSWFFSTIRATAKRNRALKEAKRVLKSRGRIYLVENYPKGEFEELRTNKEQFRYKKKSDAWLDEKGFKRVALIDTYFKFDSTKTAKIIMGNIWEEKVENKIKKRIIRHKVMILTKLKK